MKLALSDGDETFVTYNDQNFFLNSRRLVEAKAGVACTSVKFCENMNNCAVCVIPSAKLPPDFDTKEITSGNQ